MQHQHIVIDMRDVYKIYGTGHSRVTAVEDISLHVTSGAVTLIMGPSGAGKSTLLQIMGALLRPTEGSVCVDGVEIESLSFARLAAVRRKYFGFVYQSHSLLAALTAAENIELALNLNGVKGAAARTQTQLLLETVGLGSRAGHLPAELSGGEQQRVAVARAVAHKPPIILADEPTASLDSKHGYAVVEELRALATEHQSAVVIVTHDARITNLADRILWLEDGKLTAQLAAEEADIDPVCLMVVDPQRTPFRSTGRNGMRHFCSSDCLNRYLVRPERFEPRRAPAGDDSIA